MKTKDYLKDFVIIILGSVIFWSVWWGIIVPFLEIFLFGG